MVVAMVRMDPCDEGALGRERRSHRPPLWMPPSTVMVDHVSSKFMNILIRMVQRRAVGEERGWERRTKRPLVSVRWELRVVESKNSRHKELAYSLKQQSQRSEMGLLRRER